MPSTIFARFDSLSALIIDIRNAYESSHSIFIQVMLCCWKLRKNNLAPSKLDQSTAWWPQASFRQAIALNQGYFYQARLYLSAEFESVIRKAQNIFAKISSKVLHTLHTYVILSLIDYRYRNGKIQIFSINIFKEIVLNGFHLYATPTLWCRLLISENSSTLPLFLM